MYRVLIILSTFGSFVKHIIESSYDEIQCILQTSYYLTTQKSLQLYYIITFKNFHQNQMSAQLFTQNAALN